VKSDKTYMMFKFSTDYEFHENLDESLIYCQWMNFFVVSQIF